MCFVNVSFSTVASSIKKKQTVSVHQCIRKYSNIDLCYHKNWNALCTEILLLFIASGQYLNLTIKGYAEFYWKLKYLLQTTLHILFVHTSRYMLTRESYGLRLESFCFCFLLPWNFMIPSVTLSIFILSFILFLCV